MMKLSLTVGLVAAIDMKSKAHTSHKKSSPFLKKLLQSKTKLKAKQYTGGNDIVSPDGNWRLVLDPNYNVGYTSTGAMSGASGRLEFNNNGTWGTVCDDFFDSNSNGAQVACRSLGLPWTQAREGQPHESAQSSDPIWFDNVQCNGDEASVNDCQHNPIGENNCSHYEDVAVTCEGDVPAQTDAHQNGNFRMVIDHTRSTDGSTSGRFEYFYDGAWGTMCDDVADNNDNAAKVICRTLDLPWTNATSFDAQGDDSQQILLDNVDCTGSEMNIMECSMNAVGNHNCGHYEDFGVTCAGQYTEGGPEVIPTGPEGPNGPGGPPGPQGYNNSSGLGTFDFYNHTDGRYLATMDVYPSSMV